MQSNMSPITPGTPLTTPGTPIFSPDSSQIVNTPDITLQSQGNSISSLAMDAIDPRKPESMSYVKDLIGNAILSNYVFIDNSANLLTHHLFVRRCSWHPRNYHYYVVDSKKVGDGSTGAVYRIVGEIVQAQFKERNDRILKVQYHFEHINQVERAQSEYQHASYHLHMKKPIVSFPCKPGSTAITYTVSSFFKDMDLFDLLSMLERHPGTFTITEEQRFLLSINCLRALKYQVHVLAKIHRDLKPENIMVDVNTYQVNIIDFGQAKWIGEPDLTASGTRGFISPEQRAINLWVNKQKIDPALSFALNKVCNESSDLFMMAIVLARVWGATIDETDSYCEFAYLDKLFGFNLRKASHESKAKLETLLLQMAHPKMCERIDLNSAIDRLYEIYYAAKLRKTPGNELAYVENGYKFAKQCKIDFDRIVINSKKHHFHFNGQSDDPILRNLIDYIVKNFHADSTEKEVSEIMDYLNEDFFRSIKIGFTSYKFAVITKMMEEFTIYCKNLNRLNELSKQKLAIDHMYYLNFIKKVPNKYAVTLDNLVIINRKLSAKIEKLEKMISKTTAYASQGLTSIPANYVVTYLSEAPAPACTTSASSVVYSGPHHQPSVLYTYPGTLFPPQQPIQQPKAPSLHYSGSYTAPVVFQPAVPNQPTAPSAAYEKNLVSPNKMVHAAKTQFFSPYFPGGRHR